MSIRLILALLLALLGIGASIASIYATPLASASRLSCGLEALDCAAALTSKYSKVFGIPLGVFGLFYFSFWAMNLRATLRTGGQVYRTALTWVTVLGAVVSLTLGSIMFFILKAPCLYCLLTHSSNLLSVILLWPVLQFKPKERFQSENLWHFATITGVSTLAASTLFFAHTTRLAQSETLQLQKQLEASQIQSLDW